MSNNFIAGQGRIEIIGLTDNAVRNLRQVRSEVEQVQAAAARGGGAGVFGGFIGDINGATKGIRGVSGAFTRITGTAGAVAGAVASAGNAILAITDYIDRLGSGPGERWLSDLAMSGKDAASQLADVQQRLQELYSERAAIAEQTIPGGGGITRRTEFAIESDIKGALAKNRELAKQVAAQRKQASEEDMKAAITAEEKKAEVLRRTTLTEEERIKLELEDKIKELDELRKKATTDDQRRQLDAIEKVYRETTTKRRQAARESERIDLAELAKRFDSSAVIRAVNGTTAAVNGQRRGPHQPAVKD